MELMPGEQMIWEGHPTWRSMLAFHVKWIGLVLIVVGVLLLIQWAGIDIRTTMIALIGAVGIGLTILAGWIQRFFTEYAITTKRLQIRKGILSKTESSANVDRIQNITTYQSVVDRVFQCGTLDFDTAGDSGAGDDGFRFAGVNEPQDLRERIVRAREADEAGTTARGDQGGLA